MNPGLPSRSSTVTYAAIDAASAPPAVRAVEISKTFRIPHGRRHTVREYVLHPFHRTTYETQNALDNVSFEIQSGEFFGVIGRNGSGKSTLLKVLAGIYSPDDGHVEVNGQLSPFIELGVGFNPELSARDNVHINGTLMGLSPREISARFDDIIAFGELERFVDQKLKNYSSGMQLRLAYSIAIQVPFDILLLDEVLAVGDQNFQEKCFATFEDMRAAGKTVVLVTHDLRAVARFCDRALLLRDGLVQGAGSPEEVTELYLEQERRRAATNGRPAQAVAASAIRTETATASAAKEVDRAETMRTLERRWHGLTVEDVAFMSDDETFEVIKTQQAYLAERARQADRLYEELREARREMSQLSMMVDILVRRTTSQLPLPPPALRLGKRASETNFLAQGLVDADHVLNVFGESPEDAVLEWGCGSGRMYRWLDSYASWRANYRGCDPDTRAVEWLAATGANAVAAPDRIPLPYDTESFGGVIAINKLSALPADTHRAWYEELRRLLRGGGLAYLVLQGRNVLAERDGSDDVRRDLDENGFSTIGTVTLVTRRFVEEATAGLFAIERAKEGGHKTMDAYVLRRLD
jgi:ABC-type polysaccharide/polyol phosphate transport system ATPase subunit/SAM-dependent methyltransferase